MFTDNDELAGLIAAQINADKLIILTNVKGVYTKDPKAEDSEFIHTIAKDDDWPEVSSVKSDNGRGGMISKLSTARKMSMLGITTHIVSIEEDSVITRLIDNESVGTLILPDKKKSNIKRWIAYNANKHLGSISINECLHKILIEKKRVISILPVGIVKCDGDFKKGDLVEILSGNGHKIGIGIAKYDAKKLTEYLTLKEKPEFMHYDHLHIF